MIYFFMVLLFVYVVYRINDAKRTRLLLDGIVRDLPNWKLFEARVARLTFQPGVLKGYSYFYMRIEYHFSVLEKDHGSDTVLVEHFRPLFFNSKKLSKIEDKYVDEAKRILSVGASIRGFYNPENPEESMLFPWKEIGETTLNLEDLQRCELEQKTIHEVGNSD